MRKPLIAGNWKMNKTAREAAELVQALKDKLGEVDEVEVVLCPPFTALDTVKKFLPGTSIGLGAQNVHWEEKGAYTGEVSASMIKESGCHYVIIGHSERRQYFGETNETVNKKVKSALKVGLTPIVCVGERLEEREKDETFQVIDNHVKKGLAGLSDKEILKIVVAYEPVWAIGTGKTATPRQANEVHAFIRHLLSDIYSKDIASQMRILYGGSVKPDNISSLISEPEIDGALVGGSSLDAQSFSEIVEGAR